MPCSCDFFVSFISCGLAKRVGDKCYLNFCNFNSTDPTGLSHISREWPVPATSTQPDSSKGIKQIMPNPGENQQQALAKPKHILQLSAEERRRFLDSFDNVYSDIDGVVWCMKHTIPQAPDAFAALQRVGKPTTFISNNSVRAVQDTVKSFQNVGMQVTPEQVWHPAKTMVHYLRSIQFDGLIYIIATANFKAHLTDAGFQLIDGPHDRIEGNDDMLRHIFDKQPVRAVVIDTDLNISSVKLQRAYQYLRNPNCDLLIGGTDRFFAVTNDVNILGPALFNAILVEASGKEPKVFGKPGKELGNQLLQQHNIKDPRRVLMIGDMLEQDIRFGRLCGYQTLLVLSGGCTLEEMQGETNAELLPDYYADSMADFLHLLGGELS